MLILTLGAILLKIQKHQNYGVGAAATANPPAVHADMQVACTNEQLAAALVSQTYHPTGPVTPATNPELAMQVTYPALHAL